MIATGRGRPSPFRDRAPALLPPPRNGSGGAGNTQRATVGVGLAASSDTKVGWEPSASAGRMPTHGARCGRQNESEQLKIVLSGGLHSPARTGVFPPGSVAASRPVLADCNRRENDGPIGGRLRACHVKGGYFATVERLLARGHRGTTDSEARAVRRKGGQMV